MPSPFKSGAGWTSSPGRIRSPILETARSQSDRIAAAVPRRRAAVSQIGLPVDPSRRIRVSPVHSIKSALPGSARRRRLETGMDSPASKRLSDEGQVKRAGLAAIEAPTRYV